MNKPKSCSRCISVAVKPPGKPRLCVDCWTKDHREYRAKNYDPKKRRAYYEANKERARETNQEWKARNKDKVLKQNRKSYRKTYRLWQYGLTHEDYQALLMKQKNRCAICKRRPEKNKVLVVDHCHKTNKVRGLLCNTCNGGLGMFKDNGSILIRALEYLTRIE